MFQLLRGGTFFIEGKLFDDTHYVGFKILVVKRKGL